MIQSLGSISNQLYFHKKLFKVNFILWFFFLKFLQQGLGIADTFLAKLLLPSFTRDLVWQPELWNVSPTVAKALE